ncbi:MAG: division/cell wall cluster transcriptional repressor MraZ [Sterolibacterium sp.]|nr:division/cell wall cluster transcriptional repressor MraZ [Sterolibacterium sp.]MBP9800442.1 division/cell wall cluster transcriptional repressor MraZ [Sterolibacterium sp.]
MFQGATQLNLDAKGRMAVPARHRDALQVLGSGRLVLTAHPHRCLLLYPAPAWEPVRDRVLAVSSLDAQSALLRRLLVGNAIDTEMDAAGRLLVTPELRRYASLEKEIWLVGQGSHFEIWSEAGWQAQQDAIFALGDKLLPPGLENLAL